MSDFDELINRGELDLMAYDALPTVDDFTMPIKQQIRKAALIGYGEGFLQGLKTGRWEVLKKEREAAQKPKSLDSK